VFFYGAAYQKSQSAVFVLPEKGVPSAVVGTVYIGCSDVTVIYGVDSRKAKGRTSVCYRQARDIKHLEFQNFGAWVTFAKNKQLNE